MNALCSNHCPSVIGGCILFYHRTDLGFDSSMHKKLFNIPPYYLQPKYMPKLILDITVVAMPIDPIFYSFSNVIKVRVFWGGGGVLLLVCGCFFLWGGGCWGCVVCV
jgi:hypothetical protein